jgi:hypothetical protein
MYIYVPPSRSPLSLSVLLLCTGIPLSTLDWFREANTASIPHAIFRGYVRRKINITRFISMERQQNYHSRSSTGMMQRTSRYKRTVQQVYYIILKWFHNLSGDYWLKLIKWTISNVIYKSVDVFTCFHSHAKTKEIISIRHNHNLEQKNASVQYIFFNLLRLYKFLGFAAMKVTYVIVMVSKLLGWKVVQWQKHAHFIISSIVPYWVTKFNCPLWNSDLW